MTIQELYNYAFNHLLLDEDVEVVLTRISKEENTKQNVFSNAKNNSKWDTLIEYTYEDVLELFSL